MTDTEQRPRMADDHPAVRATDVDSLLGLLHATAERTTRLRQLATTVRLGSVALRDAVGTRRAGSTVGALRDLRAVVIGTQQRADNLERALSSNRRIGMAIGILMATRHLPEDQALDCLRQESQRRNVKLRDLAEQVIYTGSL